MDFQWIVEGMSKWVGDGWHDILHAHRMSQRKDLRIWCSYRTSRRYSQSFGHIQDDSLHRGPQSNFSCKYKTQHHFSLCTQHWSHTGRDYRDFGPHHKLQLDQRICNRNILHWKETQEMVHLLGRWLQPAYGSPSYPSKHEHFGWWFWVAHSALKPQTPTHGSLHLWFTQALLDGQSWCITHSGRQLGGAPSIPGKQLQMARSWFSRHSALAPHGLGTHGLACLVGSSYIAVYNKQKILKGLII